MMKRQLVSSQSRTWGTFYSENISEYIFNKIPKNPSPQFLQSVFYTDTKHWCVCVRLFDQSDAPFHLRTFGTHNIDSQVQFKEWKSSQTSGKDQIGLRDTYTITFS
ncbi:hypothetical protein ILYODFUR_038819 [Ilyodon furcidens]|uniref:Uncharacterized protein n=1 Tax=Ilyodon furcidens TaxID=33524 RepID=A0ABV0TQF1_9TELE